MLRDQVLLTWCFQFRMEFNQVQNEFENAQCPTNGMLVLSMFGWNNKAVLEKQHFGDGIVSTDGINSIKWIFCQKYKKTFTCITYEVMFMSNR